MQASVIRRARSPLALAVAMAFAASSVHAATITVADDGDSGSPSTCNLRQAMEAANTDAVAGACAAGNGADIIEFDASLANAAIALAGSELAVAATTTLTINGSAQTINANTLSRVIRVDDSASLTISNVTLTGGSLTGGGQARSNKANKTTGFSSPGAGIYLEDSAALHVSNSTITGNTASGDGGGIYAYDNNNVTIVDSSISGNSSGGTGGGVYLYGTTLVISGSTISGNIADDDGGGLYATSNSSVSIVNSTFSGNNSATGGAIFIKYGTALSAVDSTISGNAASAVGGGVYAGAGAGGQVNLGGGTATITLANTILTGNTAPADADLYADSEAGSITIASSLLGNALQAGFSGSGNVFNDVSGLAALADNGGPTPTMLPQAGSPAIDAGDNGLIPVGISTDQRGAGFVRIANTTVDIGALEVQALVVPGGGGPSIPVPVRAPWALGLLGALLALVGWRSRRRYNA